MITQITPNMWLVIMFVIMIACVFIFMFKPHEKFDSVNSIEHLTTMSNEALQTLASVYNTSVITAPLVKTDTLTSVSGQLQLDSFKTTDITASNNANIGNNIMIGHDGIIGHDLSTGNNVTIGGALCTDSSTCLSPDNLKGFISYWAIRDKMYDTNAIIYDEIFNIFGSQPTSIISKSGNPSGWDQSSYVTGLWNSKHMLRIGGSNNVFPNGLKINVPPNMSVIWFRILNDRWTTFVLYDVNGNNLGYHASGFRSLNPINPNGAATDSYWNVHMWMPIPIPTSKSAQTFIVCSSDPRPDGWVSGLAFSTNIWNHAMDSAIGYLDAKNGGTPIAWNTENWNNEQLGMISGPQKILMVPVVPSDHDKLFYIVEHNNNWTGTMHTSITANDVQIENLKTTYSNPFATHFNSKQYNRYIAAKIPKSLIKPTDRFVKIVINMQNQNNNINFREAGTHDYL